MCIVNGIRAFGVLSYIERMCWFTSNSFASIGSGRPNFWYGIEFFECNANFSLNANIGLVLIYKTKLVNHNFTSIVPNKYLYFNYTL